MFSQTKCLHARYSVGVGNIKTPAPRPRSHLPSTIVVAHWLNGLMTQHVSPPLGCWDSHVPHHLPSADRMPAALAMVHD